MTTPRTFPSEVFARLAPEIFFERNLAKGERPTGRKFDECRPITVIPGDDSSLNNALGSAVVRAGSATVVCGITGGLTHFPKEGGVYANVEIHRGGQQGRPTLEEQVTTMQVHRLVSASKIPAHNFELNADYELCLNARIIVLSRTGPIIDLVWTALVAASKNTTIPEFVVDDRTQELVPSMDARRPSDSPNELADVHRTFGVTKVGPNNQEILLADIDGAVEEECVIDRISYAKSQEMGSFSAFSISAPNGVSEDTVRAALSS